MALTLSWQRCYHAHMTAFHLLESIKTLLAPWVYPYNLSSLWPGKWPLMGWTSPTSSSISSRVKFSSLDLDVGPTPIVFWSAKVFIFLMGPKMDIAFRCCLMLLLKECDHYLQWIFLQNSFQDNLLHDFTLDLGEVN